MSKNSKGGVKGGNTNDMNTSATAPSTAQEGNGTTVPTNPPTTAPVKVQSAQERLAAMIAAQAERAAQEKAERAALEAAAAEEASREARAADRAALAQWADMAELYRDAITESLTALIIEARACLTDEDAAGTVGPMCQRADDAMRELAKGAPVTGRSMTRTVIQGPTVIRGAAMPTVGIPLSGGNARGMVAALAQVPNGTHAEGTYATGKTVYTAAQWKHEAKGIAVIRAMAAIGAVGGAVASGAPIIVAAAQGGMAISERDVRHYNYIGHAAGLTRVIGRDQYTLTAEGEQYLAQLPALAR